MTPSRLHRLHDERGTGLVATTAAVAAFLGFLFVAAHVLLHLYATSVVTAAAFDAARIVSGSDGGPAARQTAVEHARALLGAWTAEADVEFTRIDEDAVSLRIRATSPSLVPRALAAATPLGHIDRTVTLRTERVR
jgi:hypothetical protein